MTGSMVFDPLLPWPVLAIAALVVLAFLALATWRGLAGWALRAVAALVLLAAGLFAHLQRQRTIAARDPG